MDRSPQALQALLKELELVEGLDLLTATADLERYSRDAYDYSPVLEPLFRDCRAHLVVRPHSVDAVVAVAAACARARIPLTLRGSGTGNYGQCVPLEGGVVMLMGELRSQVTARKLQLSAWQEVGRISWLLPRPTILHLH